MSCIQYVKQYLLWLLRCYANFFNNFVKEIITELSISVQMNWYKNRVNISFLWLSKQVHDGLIHTAKQLSIYEGNAGNQTVESTTSSMLVIFSSDSSNAGHGFFATYKTHRRGKSYQNICHKIIKMFWNSIKIKWHGKKYTKNVYDWQLKDINSVEIKVKFDAISFAQYFEW